jgi:hypothetical protein
LSIQFSCPEDAEVDVVVALLVLVVVVDEGHLPLAGQQITFGASHLCFLWHPGVSE